jgi:hypothetical protein
MIGGCEHRYAAPLGTRAKVAFGGHTISILKTKRHLKTASKKEKQAIPPPRIEKEKSLKK